MQTETVHRAIMKTGRLENIRKGRETKRVAQRCERAHHSLKCRRGIEQSARSRTQDRMTDKFACLYDCFAFLKADDIAKLSEQLQTSYEEGLQTDLAVARLKARTFE